MVKISQKNFLISLIFLSSCQEIKPNIETIELIYGGYGGNFYQIFARIDHKKVERVFIAQEVGPKLIMSKINSGLIGFVDELKSSKVFSESKVGGWYTAGTICQDGETLSIIFSNRDMVKGFKFPCASGVLDPEAKRIIFRMKGLVK